ncbi:MAG: sarcosine oxidase subunit gamma [Betaproteobacteria bacterium]|nr:sarcosine oxidase subunit gamma [Betaproteobacteria bacterium]
MVDLIARPPLAAKTGGGPLGMSEITGEILFNLRGLPKDEKFTAAAAEFLGGALPVRPNTTTAAAGRTIFWLGPDEWLVRAPETAHAETAAALEKTRRAAKDGNAAVAEVSDYYTVIRISGGGARAALAAGCPLDLHPQQFTVGQCAQSRFGRAAILLFLRGGAPVFDIQVRRSFADYLWEYLRAAGGE